MQEKLPPPFYDVRHNYFDEAIEFAYDVQNMAEANPNMDCGDLQIKFFDARTRNERSINSYLFEESIASSDPDTNSTTIFRVNKLNTYYGTIPPNTTFNIGYRVSYVDYPL